jgi:hypothetical protein
MKRLVIFVLAAVAVLLIAGCAPLKSYYFAVGNTVTGDCLQVTTADPELQNSLVGAGYLEGTCAAQGFQGTHYCTYNAAAIEGGYEISVYWGTDYDATEIETTCTSAGWTFY